MTTVLAIDTRAALATITGADIEISTITLAAPLAADCDLCGEIGPATCTVTDTECVTAQDRETTELTVHERCVVDAVTAGVERVAGNDCFGYAREVTVEIGVIAVALAA